MNGLPYYKAYPRDFIEGTIGMDFETKAAYRLVLDLIYMQNGKLPDDARYISGLLGCSVKKWKSLRERLVEAGKIIVSGDYLRNYRADKELETLGKFQDKQRKNRAGPNKNNDLQSPPSDHSRDYTEPEPEEEVRPTVSSPPSGRSAEIDQAFEAYNEAAGRLGLPKASTLNRARKSKLGVRLKDHGLDGWLRALKMLERSPHCLGENDRGWRADLDFLLQERGFTRLIEGAYERRSNGHPARASPDELEKRRDLYRSKGLWSEKWGDPPKDITPPERKPEPELFRQ